MMPALLVAAVLALGAEPAGNTNNPSPAAAADSAPAKAPDAPAPANTAATARDDDEKRTCRRERRTGSNMVTRVCRTASERRRDAEAARDALINGQSVDNLDIGN